MISNETLLTIARTVHPITDQSSVLVRRSSLANMENKNSVAFMLNSSFFGDAGSLHISRQDVFDARNGDMTQFLLKALYWGFPTNSHGICSKVIENWETILSLTENLLTHPSISSVDYVETIYPVIQQCKGVGMGFFSKLFYFANLTIDDDKCIILDSFVYKGLERVQGFEKIRRQTSSYTSAPLPYLNYINGINIVSREAGVSPDCIEFSLFKTGR